MSLGNGGRPCHPRPGFVGMIQFQRLGVQGLPREFDRHDSAVLFGGVIERVIRAVADQRQAFVRRLHANLMRAARLQIEFQFRNDAARTPMVNSSITS